MAAAACRERAASGIVAPDPRTPVRRRGETCCWCSCPRRLVFVGVSAAAADARGRRVVEGVLLGLLLGPIGMLIESLLPAAAKPGGAAPLDAPQETLDAASSTDRPLSPWLFAVIVLAAAGLLACGTGGVLAALLGAEPGRLR